MINRTRSRGSGVRRSRPPQPYVFTVPADAEPTSDTAKISCAEAGARARKVFAKVAHGRLRVPRGRYFALVYEVGSHLFASTKYASAVAALDQHEEIDVTTFVGWYLGFARDGAPLEEEPESKENTEIKEEEEAKEEEAEEEEEEDEEEEEEESEPDNCSEVKTPVIDVKKAGGETVEKPGSSEVAGLGASVAKLVVTTPPTKTTNKTPVKMREDVVDEKKETSGDHISGREIKRVDDTAEKKQLAQPTTTSTTTMSVSSSSASQSNQSIMTGEPEPRPLAASTESRDPHEQRRQRAGTRARKVFEIVARGATFVTPAMFSLLWLTCCLDAEIPLDHPHRNAVTVIGSRDKVDVDTFVAWYMTYIFRGEEPKQSHQSSEKRTLEDKPADVASSEVASSDGSVSIRGEDAKNGNQHGGTAATKAVVMNVQSNESFDKTKPVATPETGESTSDQSGQDVPELSRAKAEIKTEMTKSTNEELEIPKPVTSLMLVISNESRIAVGLTGATYKATMDGTTPVAVKIVKNVQSKRAVNRFYDEIQRLQSLPSHPHAVKCHGYVPIHNGRQVGIVTELVAGHGTTTLLNRLYRSPASSAAMAEKTKYRVILQLLDALVHLHYNNVTHRDVSPKHVLLTSKNGVVSSTLVDFGLPTLKNGAVSALAATGALGFDPAYASPELLSGELAVDDVEGWKKSDVYSFAVLLMEILLEEHPWEGELPVFFTKAVRKRGQRPFDVEDIRVYGRRSSELETVISQAWRQKPGERPTAAALRGMLEPLLLN